MKKYKYILGQLTLILLLVTFTTQGALIGRTYLENQNFKHIIAPGDTLFDLSQKFTINLEELKQLNPHLDPEKLQIGSRVKIPINENLKYHVVQSGDSLWLISQKYNIPLNHLISYNQIANPHKLQPLEIILFPKEVQNKVRTVLYYLKHTDYEAFLIPEERMIPVERNFYKGVLKQLIQGPVTRTDGFMPIPPETEVISVVVNNSIATVNFSEDIKKAIVGTVSEALLLHAIINSLTEFKEITGVKILINGQAGDSIGGHISLDEVYKRNLAVVRY